VQVAREEVLEVAQEEVREVAPVAWEVTPKVEVVVVVQAEAPTAADRTLDVILMLEHRSFRNTRQKRPQSLGLDSEDNDQICPTEARGQDHVEIKLLLLWLIIKKKKKKPLRLSFLPLLSRTKKTEQWSTMNKASVMSVLGVFALEGFFFRRL